MHRCPWEGYLLLANDHSSSSASNQKPLSFALPMMIRQYTPLLASCGDQPEKLFCFQSKPLHFQKRSLLPSWTRKEMNISQGCWQWYLEIMHRQVCCNPCSISCKCKTANLCQKRLTLSPVNKKKHYKKDELHYWSFHWSEVNFGEIQTKNRANYLA